MDFLAFFTSLQRRAAVAAAPSRRYVYAPFRGAAPANSP
jgi:hypothetical protein